MGANLINANLQGANLMGANLIGANLLGANLRGAYLINTNFENASLWRASLSGANLMAANLRYANLYNADLTGADLRFADLTEARITEAQLKSADGTRVRRTPPQKPLPAFLSAIDFKIDVEINETPETPENQDSILARLEQLSSDVARLAGISKEQTPAKTVLAAIEASNLTLQIMELVSDAVLDCAEME